MKLYIEMLRLLANKLKGKNNGECIKEFSTNMGTVYIKLAQILATQNYGQLFTEEDRKELSSICDNINPISFSEIRKILIDEYEDKLINEYGSLNNMFEYIDPIPVGSASISQVHRAILNSGEEVALKVKRKDVANKISSDIEQLKRLMLDFGWVVGFKNTIAGNKALDLYLEWIKTETDFHNEIENIKLYQQFADSVNGKIEGAKDIVVPRIYEEFCTDNIIAMDYIKYDTLNKLEITSDNKAKIINAVNSYIRLSFYALFQGLPIVFHGDPHTGNVYVDDSGNIGFLDMGLVFKLDKDDAELIKDLYLQAYSGNVENLYNILIPYAEISSSEKEKFRDDLRKYIDNADDKSIPYYFTEVVSICLKYQFLPPEFLFGMTKTFLCLDGVENIVGDDFTAYDLLHEATIEFLLERAIKDSKDIFNNVGEAVKSGFNLGSEVLQAKSKHDLTKVFVKGISSNYDFINSLRKACNDCSEVLNIVDKGVQYSKVNGSKKHTSI